MSGIQPQCEGNGPSAVAASGSDIDDFLWNFGSWLTDEDEYSDIIISTRIRLARNLKGYRFPNRASNAELREVLQQVRRTCQECESLKNGTYVDIEKLSEWDCKYFVERRLASPQLIENAYPSLLIIASRESLSIMVNEEDHLRIQCLEAGFRIDRAWEKISQVDDELEEGLTFSYSDRFGYLTACPTNLGTGLRVSIFVHLPALSFRSETQSVIQQLPTSEIAVRGFYGEGTESIGNVFQISNQLTLGRTEKSVVERLRWTANKLVELEREARSRLLKEKETKVEDAVFRALGVLRHARIMSSLEAMDLLSLLRLGLELGMISDISRVAINQLMVLIQPAHLQKIYSKGLDADERDIVRAEFIRQNLWMEN